MSYANYDTVPYYPPSYGYFAPSPTARSQCSPIPPTHPTFGRKHSGFGISPTYSTFPTSPTGSTFGMTPTSPTFPTSPARSSFGVSPTTSSFNNLPVDVAFGIADNLDAKSVAKLSQVGRVQHGIPSFNLVNLPCAVVGLEADGFSTTKWSGHVGTSESSMLQSGVELGFQVYEIFTATSEHHSRLHPSFCCSKVDVEVGAGDIRSTRRRFSCDALA